MLSANHSDKVSYLEVQLLADVTFAIKYKKS